MLSTIVSIRFHNLIEDFGDCRKELMIIVRADFWYKQLAPSMGTDTKSYGDLPIKIKGEFLYGYFLYCFSLRLFDKLLFKYTLSFSNL